MRILALDIGTKRTGTALYDDQTEVTVPLDILHHSSQEEFLEQVYDLIRGREIETIIVGLPLLPSGEEGAQVAVVREYASWLQEAGFSIFFVDERYSGKGDPLANSDAMAACNILNTYLAQNIDK